MIIWLNVYWPTNSVQFDILLRMAKDVAREEAGARKNFAVYAERERIIEEGE